MGLKYCLKFTSNGGFKLLSAIKIVYLSILSPRIPDNHITYVKTVFREVTVGSNKKSCKICMTPTKYTPGNISKWSSEKSERIVCS